MRAILRWSLDGDHGSKLRNKLVPILEQAGFEHRPNTATLEHNHISPANLAAVQNEFWTIASTHTEEGRVDHFWLYVDRSEVDEIVPP